MEYVINLNDHQVEILKSILNQIEPMYLKNITPIKPKKETKTELGLRKIREYRAKKSRR